jgi:epimerase transport system membrane fusion protein
MSVATKTEMQTDNSSNSLIAPESSASTDVEKRDTYLIEPSKSKKPELGPPVLTADDIKTSDASVRMVGFVVIFVVFVVFGGWGAIAPIDSAALAPGVVKVKSNRKTVQHLEGGIVSELLVRDGDHVEVGDVLIVMDQTQARAELGTLNGQLITTQATTSRLVAERDGKAKITYPFAETSDPRINQLIRSEDQQFQARRLSQQGEVELLEQRVDQLDNQRQGLVALINSKHRLVKSYDEEIRDNKALLSEGFVSKQRLRDVQRSRDGLKGEMSEHQSNINSIAVQTNEARLQILQLNKNVQEEVTNQLLEAQAKLFDLQERISAISDRVKRTEILAPSAGMVIDLKVHTVGGVIGPGTSILDIVPKGEELIVEAEVATVDIDSVSIGMPADIRFSAFKSGTTPVIDGEVISLSADSLVNENTGMPYYLARVKVVAEGRKKLGDLKLLPGMPAEVLINTGSRTLVEYLLQPATNAFARSMIEE